MKLTRIPFSLDLSRCLILSASITAIILFIFLPLLKAIIAPLLIVLLGYFPLKILRIDKGYDLVECFMLSFGIGSLIAITLVLLADILDLAHTFQFIVLGIIFTLTMISFIKGSPSHKCDKYVYAVTLMGVTAYIYSVLTRSSFMFRYTDEYTYWTVAITIKSTEFLPNLSKLASNFFILNDFGFPSVRFVFVNLLKFIVYLTNTTSFCSTLPFLLLFWVGIGFVSFRLGALKSRLTGLVTCAIILTNPLLWLWNSRILPDMLLIFFATCSFYFFYRAFDSALNLKYLLPSVMFFTLAFFTKPMVLFWLPVFFIYAYSFQLQQTVRSFLRESNNVTKTFLRLATIPVVIITIIVVAYLISPAFRWALLLWPSLMFYPVLNFNSFDWERFLFTHEVLRPTVSGIGGSITYKASMDAWGTFLYPHYYSYPILVLMFAGLLHMLYPGKKSPINRRGSFLFIGTIVFTTWVASTLIGVSNARNTMLQLPLLATLAAIGFTSKIGKRSILLLFLLPAFLPISMPLDNHIQFLTTIDFKNFLAIDLLARSLAITVIFWKILEGTLHYFSGATLKVGQKHYRLPKLTISKQVTTILLFTLLVISHITGFYFVANKQDENGDFSFLLGLPQAGTWINKHVPQGSTIISNMMELKYYSEFRNVIPPPDTFVEFVQMINDSEVDYVVISSMVRQHRWQYLTNFTQRPPPNMMERYRYEDKFVIYKRTDEIYNNTTSQLSISFLSTGETHPPHRISLDESIKYSFLEWNRNVKPDERQIYVKDNILEVKIQAKEGVYQAVCFKIEGINISLHEPLYFFASMDSKELEVYHASIFFSNTTFTDSAEFVVRPEQVGAERVLLSRVDPSMSSLQGNLRIQRLQFWVRKILDSTEGQLTLRITNVSFLPEATVKVHSMADHIYISNVQVEAASVEAPYQTQNTTDKQGIAVLRGPVGMYLLRVGNSSIPEPIEILGDTTLNITLPTHDVHLSIVDSNGESVPQSTINIQSDNQNLSIIVNPNQEDIIARLVIGRVYNYTIDYAGVNIGEGTLTAVTERIRLKTNVYALHLRLQQAFNSPLTNMKVRWGNSESMTDKDGIVYLQVPKGERKITLEKYGKQFELNVNVNGNTYIMISLPVVDLGFGLYDLDYFLIIFISLVSVLIITLLWKAGLRLHTTISLLN